MMSESVGNPSQLEQNMNTRSSPEDSCCHSEIAFKMSVTVSRDWTKALKSRRLSSVDCEAVLKEIVSQAKEQNSHDVSVIRSEETWRLEGCFYGIKEIRKALKDEISKKHTQENNENVVSNEGAGELGSDQQSHQENARMDTKDFSGDKPVAAMDNSTLEKGEMEQREVGDSSRDQSKNNEKPEFPQRKSNEESNLKSGSEDSDSENSNNAETEQKRQRTVIEKSPEVKIIQKGVTDSGNSEDREESKREGKSKDVKPSDNLKQQVIYPDLSKLKIEYSKTQEVKVIKTENNGVTNIHNSERCDDLKKEGASKDGRHPENPKQDAKHQDLPTSRNDDYKECLKYDARYPISTNLSGLQGNQAVDLDRDRIYALKLFPSIDIDEDIFNYLVRCRNHELSLISDKCNLFEPYKVRYGHKLAVDVKPYYDTDSVKAEFRKLYCQAVFDCVDIPEAVDLESLKSLVEEMAEFKDVELRFMSQERVCKIVGSYREMTKAKEILNDVIASNSPTSQGFDTTANKKAQFNVQINITPTYGGPARTVQLLTATAASNISQATRSLFTIINHSHDLLMLSALNSLTIEVKRNDLTRIHDADVLVSCINHQLDIDGLLADQIMSAAGHYVKTELLNQKHQLRFLPTGSLVHTNAGNLTGVKAIIHVVRPDIIDFPRKDQRSRDALKNVFVNCLRCTNDKLKLKSICLPPIGLVLYEAQMVVDCFLDAVETLASTFGNGNPSAAAQHQPHPQHLTCIQLVTNDSYCIGQLIRCIKQRLESF